MMGVELFVQVFLDSALLSACVFGTLGWQGRLMNCVLAGNFVICLLSRLTGYSTDPVSYAVVPLDNFVYVLFLLLAVLLLNSVCFDSREAHIFWGTTMQFALFLLLREVCFVVLGLLDLSVGFWPVYGVRILSLLLWAALWGTGLLRWIREQLKEGDTPLCIIIGNSFLILLLVWWIWQADLLRTNLWFPILATLLALLVLIDGMVLLWDQSRIQFQRRGRLLEQYLPMVEELVESVRARQHEYNNRMMAISAAVMTTGTLDEAKAKITELTGQISLSPSDRELLKYLSIKWAACALSGFCILFIPYVMSLLCALYVVTPANVLPPHDKYSHFLLTLYVQFPLIYGLLLSAWKALLGVLTMTFGFVLALFSRNIFVILTAPFVYVILENFILASLSSASLDLATYRFVTAFEPTCKEYINLGSFIFGPVLMCLVIGAIILYYTKVKRQAIYTI